jgi:RNA polymerase sigma factor (sigma-70 family)
MEAKTMSASTDRRANRKGKANNRELSELAARLNEDACRREWHRKIAKMMSPEDRSSYEVDDIWQAGMKELCKKPFQERTDAQLASFLETIFSRLILRDFHKRHRIKRGGRTSVKDSLLPSELPNNAQPVPGERVSKKKSRAQAGPALTGDERYEPDSEIERDSMLKHEHASKMTPAEVAEHREVWQKMLSSLSSARQRRVAQLRNRGLTTLQIATAIGASESKVDSDIAEIAETWRSRGFVTTEPRRDE